MQMIINNFCIILFFLLFFTFDTTLRYFNKEIGIVFQIIILILINILIIINSQINIIIIIHNIIIFTFLYISYRLFLINIKSSSPTLTLIAIIYKKKKKNYFLKKQFVHKKIKDLIKKNYLIANNKEYIYTGKYFLIFKLLFIFKNITKMNNNG
jgi:hypothetical protein